LLLSTAAAAVVAVEPVFCAKQKMANTIKATTSEKIAFAFFIKIPAPQKIICSIKNILLKIVNRANEAKIKEVSAPVKICCSVK